MSVLHLVDPADDVAVATRAVTAGERFEAGGRAVAALQDIPQGHKMALRAVPRGAPIRKYGWAIGHATADIAAGEHVHSHNLATGLSGELAYAYTPRPPAPVAGVAAEFMGYRRANGRVGTRNEIWVLCTVGCVGRTAERIASLANERFRGRVDGVHAFPHPFGCSQLGDDLDRTRGLLAALAAHPNAGGVLILGLGCENNQLDRLLAEAGPLDPARVRSFAAQTAEDEIEEGLAALAELVAVAEQDRRVPCPLSDLVVGLKCGGSDGFSGLTANPLVGRIADRVWAAGGTPVLTEIPEVFGAERLLMDRAVDEAVFRGVVDMVNGFKRYFLDHNQPVYENPSPGNVAGGITTLEEKSLGAVQKGGRAPVAQVLPYGARVAIRPGLALLEAPGNDAVSSTALTAAGATLILFTTGRGTPLGFPVPTLKISSNPDLARRKPGWIDFDAGVVLEGVGMDEAAERLLRLVLDTASGQPARNEVNGQREIAIWKDGVTL
ncbi:MAG TPA: altronate dehydratase family protein [Azospirillaceae bacterium]|nr:altronate dehydratase family protein [Azospirillaceae bacterium]